MNSFLLLIVLSFLSLSFTSKTQDEMAPKGDTRMGTDAATSGTDIDDKDMQALEDKRNEPDSNQETQKKEIKTNGTDDHGLPTN